MLITNLISRYMKLCKAAFSAEDGAKLNKSMVHQEFGVIDIINVVVEDNKPPL